MNFSELVQEVMVITNRPNLLTETESAVKAATLKLHNTDFYAKDLYETGVEFPTEDYKQSLDYMQLIPNFRNLKYFRLKINHMIDSGPEIKVVTPEEVFDGYGRLRADIAYVAGRNLEIRASVPFKYALLGAYVNPVVTSNNYASWVALQFPYAIIHEAARRMLIMVGDMEGARAQTVLAQEETDKLISSSLTDIGY